MFLRFLMDDCGNCLHSQGSGVVIVPKTYKDHRQNQHNDTYQSQTNPESCRCAMFLRFLMDDCGICLHSQGSGVVIDPKTYKDQRQNQHNETYQSQTNPESCRCPMFFPFLMDDCGICLHSQVSDVVIDPKTYKDQTQNQHNETNQSQTKPESCRCLLFLRFLMDDCGICFHSQGSGVVIDPETYKDQRQNQDNDTYQSQTNPESCRCPMFFPLI